MQLMEVKLKGSILTAKVDAYQLDALQRKDLGASEDDLLELHAEVFTDRNDSFEHVDAWLWHNKNCIKVQLNSAQIDFIADLVNGRFDIWS